MDFKAQEYILKIIECGSISKAAEQLYTSQPALSRYIAKLEQELGTLLFDRSKTPISLTYAGELYADFAREVLSLDENLKEALQAFSSHKTGNIAVGIPHMRSAYMLPSILARFRLLFPGVTVQVVERSEMELENLILKGNIPMAILPTPLFNQGLSWEFIYRETLNLVTPKNLLTSEYFMDNRILCWPKVLTLPFALHKKDSPLRTLFDGFCRQYNCADPNIYMETNSAGLIVQLAVHGLAVSILPEYSTRYMYLDEAVDEYPLTAGGTCWDVCLIHKSSHKLSFLEHRFLDVVRELFHN